MLEKFKMMIAARRVKSKKQTRKPARRAQKNRKSLWVRILGAICWVYNKIAQCIRFIWKKICQFARWIWKKLCAINLVGLLNLALLISIFVLCIMLIFDIVGCRKKPVVIVTDPIPVSSINEITQNPAVIAEPTTKAVRTRVLRPRTITSSGSHNTTSDKNNTKQNVEIVETMHGDIIVENSGDTKILHNQTEINGNLYLQNMHRYTLPCDIKITGNLFIRNVGMLQFCGDFEITGNIYVSPHSSFGPIPATARLGGQVIL